MLKVTSTEVTTLHTTLASVDENNVATPIVDLVTTLDTDSFALNEQCTVLNKDLYLANAADIKAQYSAYRNTVIARAQALGYQIF